jgi:hypothetical protein
MAGGERKKVNMDTGLVNRALLNVGQYPLAGEDLKEKNATYVLCRNYYIGAFLEALSEAEWTGGRKREKLMPTGRPALANRGYRRAYDLPFDCAKPVELQDNAFFEIEGRLLYTDAGGAELLYVSSGKILPPDAAVSAGKPGSEPGPGMEYLSAGEIGSVPEAILRAGGPKDFLWFGPQGYPGAPWPSGRVPGGWDEAAGIPLPLPEDGGKDEDFPGYRLLSYEPKFYEYVEKSLSAKFAMKLSDQPGLHIQLLQEALLVKREAANASMSLRAAKRGGSRWWAEEL